MILHVDGDAFFASCEIAQNERLRRKPVVAGADRGIALAVSYEAKRLGISRGMTIKEIRKNYPEVIVTHSHYDVYRTYSLRMFEIVRRYTPIVEEYSVDECFADLSYIIKPETSQVTSHTEAQASHIEAITKVAENIKRDLEKDLGMTFSIGIAPTKVLAKIASKWNKPAGFTLITPDKIHGFLEKIPVGKIWGIGPSSSAKLMRFSITTALDLAMQKEPWILEHLSKPYIEIWNELNGRSLLRVHDGAHHKYKSIMKTATFYPPSDNRAALLAELARNTERACRKLRSTGLVAQELSFYIKSQEFRHFYADIHLDSPSNVPSHMINCIEKNFGRVYDKNTNRIYRATGVILRNISRAGTFQKDLFGKNDISFEKAKIYNIVDMINHKYKTKRIYLARSMHQKITRIPHTHHDPLVPHLYIPSWGKAV